MSTPHLASCQGLRWHLRREALSIDPYRISTMGIFDGTTASMAVNSRPSGLQSQGDTNRKLVAALPIRLVGEILLMFLLYGPPPFPVLSQAPWGRYSFTSS